MMLTPVLEEPAKLYVTEAHILYCHHDAELKVEHASKASGKTQMKKKKRSKKKYTALNDMRSLAETLGDFGHHDSLAMKVTTVKSSKQRDRIVYVFF